MDVTIVAGIAGSGKSHYCNGLSVDDNVQYLPFDKWVNENTYESFGFGYEFFYGLLGKNYTNQTTSYLNKSMVGQALFGDDALNEIVVKFFTSRFASMLSSVLRQPALLEKKLVVEIPYIDNSIVFIKKRYPEVKVVIIQPKDMIEEAVIINRLLERGWDNSRIQKTFALYNKMWEQVSPLDRVKLKYSIIDIYQK